MLEVEVDPEFKVIIPLCITELNIKFKDYGNSWLTCNKEYWVKRMKNEIEEYEKSMTPASERRKCLNIINMAAMAFETTK